MLKRLLNVPERITYDRLAALCARRSAQVFSKVRLADVLPIEGSGLPDDLFAFALQAHFDFVVSDSNHRPLFAVEFDGPTHATPEQGARDAKKDQLSRRFGLPVLRVQAGDLHRTEERLDRLTGVAERWFDRATSSPGSGGRSTARSCPLCGAGMVAKDGKYGRCLSCTRYPACRGSRDLPGQAPPPTPSVVDSPIAAERPTVREPSPAASIRMSPGLIVSGILATVIVAAFTAFVTTSSGSRPHAQETAQPVVVAQPAPERQTHPASRERPTVRQAATSTDGATDRQKNILAAIVKRRGWDAARVDVEASQVLGYDRSQADLGKGEASRLITA